VVRLKDHEGINWSIKNHWKIIVRIRVIRRMNWVLSKYTHRPLLVANVTDVAEAWEFIF